MVKNIDIGIEILNTLDNGDLDKLDELFSSGSRNLNEVTPKEKWNWLHKALLGFNTNQPPKNSIEYLISKGMPINAQDVYGMTPLHYAMRSKNVDAAIVLLNAGADPNIPNVDNVTPLAMIGIMPEKLELLKLMLDKGGNVNFHNGHHTIIEALEKYWIDKEGYLPVVQLMKKYA